jgi:hypothetical protein
MHKKRVYQEPSTEDWLRKQYEWERERAIAGPEDVDLYFMLAWMLAGGRTWTLCSAFRVGSLTLFNDATSEDGAQEYAVFREGVQVESLTCSWMKPDALAATLRELDAARPTPVKDLDSPVVVATSATELVAALGGTEPIAFGCRLADLRVGDPHHPTGQSCPRCA